MLDAGGQPSTVGTDDRTKTTLVCPLTIEGRLVGVDLDLVREFRPNPDTHETDVVLRVDDQIIMLGADDIGRPIELDQVDSAGVELLSAAQLLAR